jgi:hypothetical protein
MISTDVTTVGVAPATPFVRTAGTGAYYEVWKGMFGVHSDWDTVLRDARRRRHASLAR